MNKPNYKKAKRFSSCQGFTLIEVLVALTLMAVGLTTLLELFSGSLSLAYSSRVYTTATFLANQKMGHVMLEKEATTQSGSFEYPYENFSFNVEITSQDLPVGGDDSFLSEEEAPPSPGLKKILVTISWTDGNRERHFNLETMQAMVTSHEIKD